MTICVFGAGSIGCYVGGRLAATGTPVTFVGREAMREQVSGGIHLRGRDGGSLEVTPDFGTDPAVVGDADLVVVTVKSGANKQVADQLRPLLAAGAVVLNLQNGIHGGAELRDRLPGHRVVTGMVGFNVVRDGASFQQTTAGEIMAATDPVWETYGAAFATAGVPVEQRSDMDAVLRAKLLLNLNNAINALSGLPLRTELSDRSFRRCLSLAQQEALRVMARSGPAPARLTALSPSLMARALRVPDRVFQRLGSKVLAIDPTARSSMADDLAAGRPTEVDWINGAVVDLAGEVDLEAPVNARLVALVHDAERAIHPRWTGAELLNALR
ncbi:2-dehydropantoate 2-reductase [Flexivirga endophytica]|uniref:2-dehydropantoate 2-reductase n=1 Tax=Flexivirga endophytica TaxID=1849103 RepID=A0A916TDV8_9MICO|nr:2-dehydropantoate 2-reductase [Flexivirga endophytica]GGB41468.1 2-dehydropantoate 2-reductase [Flexivirga endophytica]GHB49298.1 2-dehydropantoate 2-reductase [Flexivirga endophytica]